MSCQNLLRGGSMSPTYVLQPLFSEKSQNCQKPNNHQSQRKNKQRFEILRISEIIDVFLTKFENYKILRNKISHRFLVTTKLFDERKTLNDAKL
jgi:hypothetical protein